MLYGGLTRIGSKAGTNRGTMGLVLQTEFNKTVFFTAAHCVGTRNSPVFAGTVKIGTVVKTPLALGKDVAMVLLDDDQVTQAIPRTVRWTQPEPGDTVALPNEHPEGWPEIGNQVCIVGGKSGMHRGIVMGRNATVTGNDNGRRVDWRNVVSIRPEGSNGPEKGDSGGVVFMDNLFLGIHVGTYKDRTGSTLAAYVATADLMRHLEGW